MKLFCFYVHMHALPGSVDGAIKLSQFGKGVRDDGLVMVCTFSSVPMPQAMIIRGKNINVVISVVHGVSRRV